MGLRVYNAFGVLQTNIQVSTIQAAIDHPSTLDFYLIEVDPATYAPAAPESVTVSKSVEIFTTTNADVDPRTETRGAEAVVDRFLVLADFVDIEGFTIKNTFSPQDFGRAAVEINSGAEFGRIKNNIISSETLKGGVYIAGDVEVEQNVISAVSGSTVTVVDSNSSGIIDFNDNHVIITSPAIGAVGLRLIGESGDAVTTLANGNTFEFTQPDALGRGIVMTGVTDFAQPVRFNENTFIGGGIGVEITGTAETISEVQYDFNFAASDFSGQSEAAVALSPAAADSGFNQLIDTNAIFPQFHRSLDLDSDINQDLDGGEGFFVDLQNAVDATAEGGSVEIEFPLFVDQDAPVVVTRNNLRVFGSDNGDFVLDPSVTTFRMDAPGDVVAQGNTANTIIVGDGFAQIDGGAGDDVLSATGGSPTLIGGAGSDTLTAGPNGASLIGGAGDDLLNGGAGEDRLEGGAGDDSLNGGGSSDRAIFSGVPPGYLLTSLGGDQYVITDIDPSDGDDGVDMLSGIENLSFEGAGFAFGPITGYQPVALTAGDSGENLQGFFGDDTLSGGAGPDRLEGGFGNDVLEGGEGADRLFGGFGNDFLDGGAGSDQLEGGPGDDTIDLSIGDVIIDGGDGEDTLILSRTRDEYNLLKNQNAVAVSLKNSENIFTQVIDVERLQFGDGQVIAQKDIQSDDFLWPVNGTPGNDDLNLTLAPERIDITSGGADDIVTEEFGFTRVSLVYLDGDRFFGFGPDDSLFIRNQFLDIPEVFDEEDQPIPRLRQATNVTYENLVIEDQAGVNVTIYQDFDTPDITDDEFATFFVAGYDQYTFNPQIERSFDGGDTVGDVPVATFPNADNLATYDGADDVWEGTPTGNDVMSGLGGNDTFSGLGGQDDLFGGQGRDTLNGGPDADNLSGNEGDDLIDGGEGVTPSLDSLDEDRAFYNKPRDQYVVKREGSDLKVGDRTLEEGVDTLRNIEILVFGGLEFDAETIELDMDPLPISNQPPSDVTLTPSTPVIVENEAGAFVAGVTVTDDGPGPFTYQFSDARFEVSSGQLRLKPGVSLDFEVTGPSLPLQMTVIDPDGASYVESFSIGVQDVEDGSGSADPPGAVTLASTIVAENAAGAVIGALGLSGGSTAGVTWSVSDPRFEVESNQLKLAPGASLDYELEGDTLDVMVSAVNGDVSSSSTFALTVLDAAETVTLPNGGAIYVERGLPEARVTGGSGDDRMLGGPGDDVFDGALGGDTIRGGQGDDEIIGGAGNDRRVINSTSFVGLTGDAGDDEVSGGAGIDVVRGGAGNDIVSGGDGDDALLSGDAGDDEVYGGDGDDVILRGGADNDLLDGGAGDDRLVGDRGDDTLLGGAGADTLLGGAGNDILNGGFGNDVLIGGFLRAGGAGFDTAGDDVFVFTPGTGDDVVRDFTIGEDQIDVSAYNFASAQQLLQAANQSGANVVLDLGGGDSATLRDTSLSALGDDDFML